MKKKIIYIILSIIFAGGIVFGAIQICLQMHEYSKGADVYTGLADYIMASEDNMPLLSEKPQFGEQENSVRWPMVDFASLQEINPDIVGWIVIEGTDINYPVVQGKDNQYYLKHLLNGEWNSSGCIFLDSRNTSDFSDRHSVVYGHHMKNGTMFSCLTKYKKQEFYDKHPTILFMTPEQNFKIEVFAGYVANVEDDAWKITFGSDREFIVWLEKARERSCFESKIIPAVTDRILTLSTCSYEFDNARFVLLGKIQREFP